MQGRYGAVTTGDEVLQGADLSGKVAVVTGEPKSHSIPWHLVQNVQSQHLQTSPCHASEATSRPTRRLSMHTLALRPIAPAGSLPEVQVS